MRCERTNNHTSAFGMSAHAVPHVAFSLSFRNGSGLVATPGTRMVGPKGECQFKRTVRRPVWRPRTPSVGLGYCPQTPKPTYGRISCERAIAEGDSGDRRARRGGAEEARFSLMPLGAPPFPVIATFLALLCVTEYLGWPRSIGGTSRKSSADFACRTVPRVYE
jgi:hypothetical protein